MSTTKRKVKIILPTQATQKMFLNRGWELVDENDKDAKADLICFTGGEDVSPELYQEEPHEKTYNNWKRDIKEMEIFEKYRDLPKVGICRGGQFLNVMSGGSMWQHVNNHGLTGGHTMLDLLLSKKTVFVTSTHHQMMIPSKEGTVIAIAHCATQFESKKTSRKRPKYDTEVVWYKETMSLCYQPHPEYWLSENKNSGNQAYFFNLIDYLMFN